MKLCILTMDDISKTCTIFLERYCRKIFARTRDLYYWLHLFKEKANVDKYH